MQLLVSSPEQENMNTFRRCCTHSTGCRFSIGYSSKIAVTTFSIRQLGEPAYHASSLHKVFVRSLRSSDKSFLDVPRRRAETAKRSFIFAAPAIQNSLPVHLRQLDPITVSKRSFMKQLKTYFSTSSTHSELDPLENESATTTYGALKILHKYIHTLLNHPQK